MIVQRATSHPSHIAIFNPISSRWDILEEYALLDPDVILIQGRLPLHMANPGNQTIVERYEKGGVPDACDPSYSDLFLLKVLDIANTRRLPIFTSDSSTITPDYHSMLEKISARFGNVELCADVRHMYGNAWGVARGLERIIQQSKEQGLDKDTAYTFIRTKAAEIFRHSDFYTRREFLECMIDPELKRWADSLPSDIGPIVINCGHIDADNYRPTDADQLTMEEGLVVMRYLHLIGHEKVTIGFLFNDMRLYANFGRAVRKEIGEIKERAKKTGGHAYLNENYRTILEGYGICDIHGYRTDSIDTSPTMPHDWKTTFQCDFEGSLAFQLRDFFDALRQGTSYKGRRIHAPVQTNGNDVWYEWTDEAGKDHLISMSSPESGAPICHTLLAQLNKKYEEKGVGAILYLRDIRSECGVRGGAHTARRLFGVQIPIYAKFYFETGKGIDSAPLEKL